MEWLLQIAKTIHAGIGLATIKAVPRWVITTVKVEVKTPHPGIQLTAHEVAAKKIYREQAVTDTSIALLWNRPHSSQNFCHVLRDGVHDPEEILHLNRALRNAKSTGFVEVL